MGNDVTLLKDKLVAGIEMPDAPAGTPDDVLGRLAAIPEARDVNGWLTWLARPEKRISIVGFTETRREAPWGARDGEIWICNNLHNFVPDSWDRLYDLHDTKEIRSDKEHEAFLRNTKKPVYVWEAQPEWPSAVEFPRDEVTKAFGRYFTNSISWMIAHALLEAATEIHVYGVDMATGTEYAGQRPSCEYFLGFAAGRGCDIYVPPSSDLLKNITLYGAEDDLPIRAKFAAREKELMGRMGSLNEQHTMITAQLNQLNGALEDVRYFQTVWLNPHANRDGSAKSAEPAQSDGTGNMVDITDVKTPA